MFDKIIEEFLEQDNEYQCKIEKSVQITAIVGLLIMKGIFSLEEYKDFLKISKDVIKEQSIEEIKKYINKED